MDHYETLRAQRRTHMENAQYWKIRYHRWGGNLALQWFCTEAKLHRRVSRILWEHGTN